VSSHSEKEEGREEEREEEREELSQRFCNFLRGVTVVTPQFFCVP
jgi:hypothetical protein